MISRNKILLIGFVLCFTIFNLCSCFSSKNSLINDTAVVQKINLIVNDRKIFLAYRVYELEKDNLRLKYNIEDCLNQSDLSAIKIDNEFGMHELFGENDSRRIVDPLADKILNKWNKLNYDPNYYFHYEHVVSNSHLSFLKMMDFYNSDDLKKYEDSLRSTLINRYHSKEKVLMKYLGNEYNFKNRMIWKHQRDTLLTLIPLENPTIVEPPPQPPTKN